MGNSDSKLQFRKAIVSLTSKSSPIDAQDEEFWQQFWSESVASVTDVFALMPAAEIRALREESPSNLATLVYKAVEQLVRATDTLVNTSDQQRVVLNACRILTRILPYMFEDPDWRGFFWTKLPLNSTTGGESASASGGSIKDADGETDSEAEAKERKRRTGKSGHRDKKQVPLAHSLLTALCDLLFCPDFTVPSLPCRRGRFGCPDSPPDDLQAIDSCEYIWESGIGFTSSSRGTSVYDNNRIEVLRLLLTCFSSCMYLTPKEAASASNSSNKWIEFFTSSQNRHALPLFTSLLNTIISYEPNGILPFNHLIFSDPRESLVDVCTQILIVTLDYDYTIRDGDDDEAGNEKNDETPPPPVVDHTMHDNLFINYLSRIHREEDLKLLLNGMSRLLNNPLQQTYLPHSCRKINFHQELLVLFWKACDYNKKFMYHVLKSSDVLDILVPILYHLNDSRADAARIGLVHIGVFILLLLSGERNFGVRLNKPYNCKVLMDDVPVFSGTHADLLVIVMHKLMTAGHQRLQPLFDCLLTILVNVSPYLKTLSMVSAVKLLHLMDAFSTPWFLYSHPNHHLLLSFLLEIFNNLIQYQFDGNSNLIYTIIRKRSVFHALSNLSTDASTIQRSISRNTKGQKGRLSRQSSVASNAEEKPVNQVTSSKSFPSLVPGATVRVQSPSSSTSSSVPSARPSPPPNQGPSDQQASGSPIDEIFGGNNTLASLAATPRLERMTEMRRAHDVDLDDEVNSCRGQERTSRSSISSEHKNKEWVPTPEWVMSWKSQLPLQTVMRMLQVLVPQVERMCIEKGMTEESEILAFLQHGTLVGLLPVPHPILIRKYQTNAGTTLWFRTYMWGVIYLRNCEPAIWFDTNVQLFQIQKI